MLGIPEVEEGSNVHKLIASKELTLMGSASTTPDAFRRSIQTIARWVKTTTWKELLDNFIATKRLRFSEAHDAFRAAASGEFLKVIIDLGQ